MENTVNMNSLYSFGLYLYSLKGVIKIALIYTTAVMINPILEILSKYIIPLEWDNYAIFLILLLLDIASGIYKHSGIWMIKDRVNTLHADEFFFKLLRKTFAGGIWLILINMLNKIDDAPEYFQTFGLSVLISWLGWSIASNLYVITGSSFPPKWIMTKLKKANEDENITL